MKSFFLVTLFLTTLFTETSWSQSVYTKTLKKAPEKASEESHSASFKKFSDRLVISYFAAYSGSSLGQWQPSALDEGGTLDRGYVTNLFNQISFNYNFGWKMNFVLNPRWTNNLATTEGHTDETNTLFVIEDALAGLQGVIYSSEDKKFNLWVRAALRLPTSRTSRANDITVQPDIFANPTYDINTKWQFSGYVGFRHWVYEDRYTAYRYRLYVAPYIQYAINDTNRLQLYYENYSENRGNLKSQNGKDPNFKDYYQNAMFGLSHDFHPRVNFFPFLGYYLDGQDNQEKPLDNAWLGFWFSWKIK